MAEAENIRGKAISPFLLKHVSELTGGESLKANIALLENNARVAAQIARALRGLGWQVQTLGTWSSRLSATLR
jgi:pseudouridine-5'-phosphate glycosidase